MDSIPNLSIGTAALVIFLICAAFVMLRGISRVLIGTAVLAVSAWLGLITWQKAPDLSLAWFGKSVGFITTGMPILVFVASFILIRLILKFIATPFGKSETDELPPPGFSWIRMIFLGLIALVPTVILLAIGIGFIHHTGSIHELRNYVQKSDDTKAPQKDDLLVGLKSAIEKNIPEKWMNAIDPLAQKSRLTLAKIVATQSRPEPKPVLDPKTGKPIPRAVIVEDAEIRKLAQEGKFGTLLRHPMITKALNDPDLQQLIKRLQAQFESPRTNTPEH